MAPGSGQDVGQDALVSAAAGFSATPGAVGEVADLAFHHGPICSVVLLPARILLARFGVLQRGFLWVNADHPPPTRLRALRPQRTRLTQRTEARHAVTQPSADAYGVISRAGDGAAGQINPEPVFGIAVALRTAGTLARMS